jgi:phosphotriesterase-related protein
MGHRSGAPGSAVTVGGPVDPAALGIVLPHEHVIWTSHFIDAPTDEMRRLRTRGDAPVTPELVAELNRNPFATADNLRQVDLDLAAGELGAFADAGGRTVVDVTCRGLGRDPVALRAIAERTQLNIVAATGYYLESTHPATVARSSLAGLADEMIADLTVGIDGTSVRAGVIGELGVGQPMYGTSSRDPNRADIGDQEVRVLRAAAIAHRATGAPISVHLWNFGPNALADRVLDILGENGVSPDRVVLGHVDAFCDRDVIKAAAARGAFVEFDAFGVDSYADWQTSHFDDDETRVATLLDVIDAGFSDRVLISQDVCTKTQLHAFGGRGYDYIERSIVPMLLASGLPDAVLGAIRVDNPARLLAWST